MKREFFIAALGIVLSTGAMAQSVEIKRDTIVQESNDRYKVVTNRFFDNWFIGAGAGAQIFFGDHNNEMKFGDRLTAGYELYLGKWFSPGIGVRAAFNGTEFNGLTQNGSYTTGKPYDKLPWEGYMLEEQKVRYSHIHADVLFNLTNIFSGYRENRFYTISPYAGLGWMIAKDAPRPGVDKPREVTANVGIYNTFRLAKSLDLTLDLRGSFVNDRFDGELGGRYGEGLLTGALGLSYKFKARTWEKPKTTIIKYDDAEIDALREKVNKLAQDNNMLRQQLADAKDKTITDVKVEKRLLAAPILVTFPINKSTVSNEARVNLGFFAKVIKEGNANVVYHVTGYADKGTGSKATNERLSRERAEAIYNVLVREFGVNPTQVKVDYQGGVDNMFYDDPRLSRAVITIAK